MVVGLVVLGAPGGGRCKDIRATCRVPYVRTAPNAFWRFQERYQVSLASGHMFASWPTVAREPCLASPLRVCPMKTFFMQSCGMKASLNALGGTTRLLLAKQATAEVAQYQCMQGHWTPHSGAHASRTTLQFAR